MLFIVSYKDMTFKLLQLLTHILVKGTELGMDNLQKNLPQVRYSLQNNTLT